MQTSALDFRDRAAAFDDVDGESFDLVVVGAGITGAGVARDAAMRGLSVALVEARDIAAGTSSRSSKMVHGGLRYLAQGDIGLVREAATERQTLRRIAPHLARISPFAFPASKGTIVKLRAGLWAFEKLGKVPKAEHHEVWSSAELAEREPTVRASRFAGAVVYPEFLTNDARLTLANVRAAAAAGAKVLTYAPVTRILTEAGRAVGVECTGALPGETLGATLRARQVVNAAGPWVDAVRALEDSAARQRVTLTKGIHVVVPHDRVPVSRTIIMVAPDKRPLFAVPVGPVTYLGTTDTFYPDSDYWPSIEWDDVEYLFAAAQRTLSCEPLGPEDVVAMWAGVRPLVAQEDKSPSEISRKDEVWTGPGGVLSIAGGKLTAFRTMAERVVDTVSEQLGGTRAPCRTHLEPLVGGDASPGTLRLELEGRMKDGEAERLVDLYGSEAVAVADLGGDVRAEVEHAVSHEGALTLEDYWVRRSARAWLSLGPAGDELVAAAHAMGALLGWSEDVQDAELAACRSLHADALACLQGH